MSLNLSRTPGNTRQNRVVRYSRVCLPFSEIGPSATHLDAFRDDWSLIREAVKHKINEVIDFIRVKDRIAEWPSQNIQLFLTTTKPTPPPPHFNQIATQNGGLKIAPFPPHKTLRVHLNEKPASFMSPDEAQDAKKYIFEQLDSFDSYVFCLPTSRQGAHVPYHRTPFSVQRLCELCIKPRDHYNSVGKYLRAVEKSVLVTSTWDSFPPLTEEEQDSFGRGATMLGSTRQSAPATPLFSPIPFLHEDARRSQSASPPPSPLALAAAGLISDAHVQPLETKALGLVDEMDDPRPGHMSDHPTAISAVTDLSGERSGSTTAPMTTSASSPTPAGTSPPPQQPATTSAATTGPGTARPLFGGSLEQRFVRSGLMGPASDTMIVDEDKENNQSK